MAKQKWFHAIGASGKTTSNVAKFFKDQGWFVTGSDIQFLPPASDVIKENDIPFDEGYSFKHLNREFWEEKTNSKLDIPNHPDLCLIVESASHKNKELLYAKRINVPVLPFSKILGEHLVKKHSVVVIGTAGKTTTTTLIAKILEDLGVNPSYMIGADVVDFKDSLRKTDSDWSVLEGDEYHNINISDGAKFLEFKPKYLVITNIGYEHQDVFATREDYVEEFAKAVRIVPEDGIIVARWGDKNIDKALEGSKSKVIRYGINDQKIEVKNQNFFNIKINSRKNGVTNFSILNGASEILTGETSLIGKYNLENIVASVALVLNLPAHSLPIEMVKQGTENIRTIKDTVAEFGGPRKRLEILVRNENRIVVDDFGVAPARAENSLNTLSEEFPDYKIVSIFEPNSGSRPGNEKEFKKMYKGVFDKSYEVIVPELSEFNKDLASHEEMVKWISELGVKNVKHINSAQLQKYIGGFDDSEKFLIVFFSSYRLTQIGHEIAESIDS